MISWGMTIACRLFWAAIGYAFIQFGYSAVKAMY